MGNCESSSDPLDKAAPTKEDLKGALIAQIGCGETGKVSQTVKCPPGYTAAGEGEECYHCENAVGTAAKSGAPTNLKKGSRLICWKNVEVPTFSAPNTGNPLKDCQQGIQLMAQVNNVNAEAMAAYKVQNDDYVARRNKFDALHREWIQHTGPFVDYASPQPPDMWTGCSDNRDGDLVCRQQQLPGRSDYWHAFDENCSSCGAAHTACTGVGTSKKWKRACRYDYATSEAEWKKLEPQWLGGQAPTYNSISPGNVICQDCSNKVNIVGSQVTSAQTEQYAKCIANIQAGNKEPPVVIKEQTPKTPQTPQNTLNTSVLSKNNLYIIIGVIVLLLVSSSVSTAAFLV